MEPSVSDVTKAAFLSGYPPQNWLAVVQQLKPHPLPASEICRAIFTLLQLNPLSPVLLEYLCAALDSPNCTLPIGVYIASLIDWSQSILVSPDHSTHILSALCAIAAPRAQKPSANLAPTLPTAQGSISLVRHVHMHLAHDALLFSAALDILLAILATVTASPPNPNLSPALALHLVPAINDILDGPVSDSVRRPLTAWLFQLSVLATEGASRSYIPNPSISPDEPPGGSIQRPELLDFGGRNGPLFDVLAYELTTALAHKDDHISALHTVFNTCHNHPDVFYLHLYASLLSILANEADPNTRLLVRAATFGSLPTLLLQLEAHAGGPKLREALQSAINGLFAHYSSLLDKCDAQSYHAAPMTRAGEDAMEEDMHDDGSKGKSVRTALVQSLQCVSMLDSHFMSPAAPGLESWPGRGIGRVFAEAGENGQDIETYLKSRLLSLDVPLPDKLELMDRAVVDPETHACLCSVLYKGYVGLAASMQHMSPATLESLAQLSRLLYTHPNVLDVVGLRVPPVELAAAGLAFLEHLEGTGVGDPQSALGQYGDVLLLLQLLVTRYELQTRTLKHGDRVLDTSYLTSSWAVYNLSDLPDAERALVNEWVKAAFDSNSPGIDDNILRSTSPRVLLKLCATLLAEAIRKCASEPEAAGMEMLRNGVSYFKGPLLNWTLRGVIWALANEAERHGHAAQTHLEILQLLILGTGCPPPVIEMTRHRVLRLLASPHVPRINIDVSAIVRVLQLGSSSNGPHAPLYPSSYLNLALQNLAGSMGGTSSSVSTVMPIPNPVRIMQYTTVLELVRAPVHQGSDSIAHRNVLVALVTLGRPRFAGLKYLLVALRGLVGAIDAEFLAGVVVGAVGVWISAPGERALVRERVRRFVLEGERDKALEGIVKRIMGIDFVRACVAD